MEDGMATVRLAATYIGELEGTGLYRVDLSQSGFATIGAITVHDDNVISGGTGSHSGFDLDFIKIFNSGTTDAASILSLQGDAAFNFSSGGVAFQPGYQAPVAPGEPADWNTNLRGTTGANVYDSGLATLGSADSRELSLGEGGQVTFLFGSGLSAGGRYLYFGDTGANSEGAYVVVSDIPSDAPTQFRLVGTSAADVIRIGVGTNQHLMFTDTIVYGRGNNDRISGSFGNDTLYGEAGRDTIAGGSGADRIYGGSGNDSLAGGLGNDWIYGGTGNDRLKGDKGSDNFVFNTGPNTRFNSDRIVDFNPLHDSIYLENAVFKKVGNGSMASPNKLKHAAFWRGSEAHDANDRIIYDKATGALYYDRDGTGAAAQIKFAQLSKGLKVSHHDFFVI
jgi:Ca2+-binding RTX toxin-like protein